MENKRYIPEKELKKSVIDEVVAAEAIGLYPSNQMDDGMIPRSKATSRAGIDANGESNTKKK